MSKRTNALEEQVRALQDELDAAKREVREVSGANGRLAAQVDSHEVTITTLVEENATLSAALGARTDDATAGFTS